MIWKILLFIKNYIIKETYNTITMKPTSSPPVWLQDFTLKILIIAGIIIVWYFLYEISSILIILFLALFLNILFAPFLNTLNKWKIGNAIGIVLIYMMIALFLLVTLFAIIPIFVTQISSLVSVIDTYIKQTVEIYNQSGIDGFAIPEYIKDLLINIDFSQILNTLKDNIGQISTFVTDNLKTFFTNGFGILSSVTNAIINSVLLIIFTFFIALERKQIRSFFYTILPKKTSKYILSKETSVVDTLYNWLKSQIILWVIMFVCTCIGLLILKIFGIHLSNIFTLALIAGVMEFIPYLWPILAFLPALAIALWVSFKATIAVTILYIIIQQLENNVFVPFVMGKTLSLSPFAVLIGMMIGASLLGILWIILAVPLVAIIQIFLSDYLNRK